MTKRLNPKVETTFLLEQIETTLEFLSSRHALLLSILLALNAVTRFYAGIVHDASVYSLQAVNRATGGQFADDLFLRYGSQDRFSIVSFITGPLTALLGLKLCFFLLYLASIVLLLWASTRLLFALLPDKTIATAGALFIAVASLPFGGLDIFHVSEPFFTPRLPACALTLLGLELTIRRLYAKATFPLLLAALLHPIMAVPGIVIWSAELLLERMRFSSVLLLSSGSASLGLFLLTRSSVLGLPLPLMDEEWRHVVRSAAPYNFVEDWQWSDWLELTGTVLIIAAAIRASRRTHPRVSRFLVLALVIAIGGLAMNIWASHSTHALLFQAQPYRALWILAFLKGPCGLWLAVRAYVSSIPARRLFAPAIVWHLGRSALFPLEAAIALSAFAVFALAGILKRTNPLPVIATKAAWHSLWIAIAVASVGVPLGLLIIAQQWISQNDPISYVRVLTGSASAPALVFLVILALGAFQQRLSIKFWPLVPILMTCGFLVVQTSGFTLPQSARFRHQFERDANSIAFAQRMITNVTRQNGSVPTVYSDFIPAQTTWIDLHAKTYFHLTQTVGVIFNAEQSREVTRRAAIVSPFEVRHYRRTTESLSKNVRLMIARLFSVTSHAVQPSASDLTRLCSDPLLDFALIQGPRLASRSVTNGDVHIYDCVDFRDATQHLHTPRIVANIEASS